MPPRWQLLVFLLPPLQQLMDQHKGGCLLPHCCRSGGGGGEMKSREVESWKSGGGGEIENGRKGKEGMRIQIHSVQVLTASFSEIIPTEQTLA